MFTTANNSSLASNSKPKRMMRHQPIPSASEALGTIAKIAVVVASLICSSSLLLGLNLPQADALPIETLAVPPLAIDRPTSFTGVAVSFSPEHGKTLFLVSRSNGSVIHYFFHNKSYIHIMGGKGLTCEMDDTGKPFTSETVIAPKGVEAINDHTILIADHMAGSRIFSVSTPNGHIPFTHQGSRYTKAVGGSCNYSQPEFVPGTSTSTPIGPPEYTLYLHDRDELLYTQFDAIVSVQNDTMTTFFGRPGTYGGRKDTFNKDPIPRLSATTNGPCQMVRAGENVFVAERRMGIVRKISLSTNMASVAVGSFAFTWPPPSCGKGTTTCTLAQVGLVSPKGLAAVIDPATKHTLLYIGDASVGVIFQANLDTDRVVIVAGQMLNPGRRDGDESRSLVSSVSQLSASEEELFVTDGTVRRVVFPKKYALPVAPNQEACSVFKHCSGRAKEAYGLPSINCTCVCKDGWESADCSQRASWNIITKTPLPTRTKSVSETLIPPTDAPTPNPPPPPDPLQDSAEVTVLVTSVAVGIVNPTIAAQASRAKLLIQASTCEKDVEEALDFTKSALQLTLGTTAYRNYWGAVVGNVGLVALLLISHWCWAYLDSVWNDVDINASFKKLRFPSVHAFWLLLLMEGTVMTSTTILIYAEHRGVRFGGFVGLAACVGLTLICAWYFKFRFKADYRSFAEKPKTDVEETGAQPQTERLMMRSSTSTPNTEASITNSTDGTKSSKDSGGNSSASSEGLRGGILGWLVDPRGKWKDDENYTKSRLGLFFYDYTPACVGFVAVEFTMCITTGILEAIQPDGSACMPILCCIAVAYTLFFLVIVIKQPFLTRINFFGAALVAGFQAIAAIQLVILVLSGDERWKDTSNYFTIVSMYVVALKGLFDIFEALKLGVRFCMKKVQKRRRSALDAEAGAATSGRLDVPLTSMVDNNSFMMVNNSFVSPPEIVNDSFLLGPAGPTQQMEIVVSDHSTSTAPPAPRDASFDYDEFESILAQPQASDNNVTPMGSRKNTNDGPRELLPHEVMRQHLEQFATGGQHGLPRVSTSTTFTSSGTGSTPNALANGSFSRHVHQVPNSYSMLARQDSNQSLHQRTPSTFSSANSSSGSRQRHNVGRFSSNNSFNAVPDFLGGNTLTVAPVHSGMSTRHSSSSNTMDNHSFSSQQTDRTAIVVNAAAAAELAMYHSRTFSGSANESFAQSPTGGGSGTNSQFKNFSFTRADTQAAAAAALVAQQMKNNKSSSSETLLSASFSVPKSGSVSRTPQEDDTPNKKSK